MSCLLIAWLRMKTSTSREFPWPGGQEILLHEPVSSPINLLPLTQNEETLTGPESSWDPGRRLIPSGWCLMTRMSSLSQTASVIVAEAPGLHVQMDTDSCDLSELSETLWYSHPGSQWKKLDCEGALELWNIRAIKAGQKEGPSVQDPYFQEPIRPEKFHLQRIPCDQELTWPDVPSRASKTSKVSFSLPWCGEAGVTRTRLLSWKG